jgi:hypothetical protein
MKAGFWAEASAPTFFGLIAFIKKDKILYIDSKPIRAIMLHPLHRQRYQDFQKALEQLQKTVTAKDLQESALLDNVREVQKLFQSQIANLSAEDCAPDDASRWQSIQTEIYKQMRLLQTDVMRLQASRSYATSLSRTSSVSDRINTLIQYCQALLQL